MPAEREVIPAGDEDRVVPFPGDARPPHGRGMQWAQQSPRIFVDSGEEVARSLGEFIGRMVGWAGQFPVKTAAFAL